MILLFLSPLGVYPASLTSFLAASAFAQWLALASALLLCKAGPVLSRFSSPLSYALAATLSGMLSALAAWLVYVLDREFQYRALQHLHPAQFCLGTALMMALLSAVMLRYFYVRDQWRDQVRANAKASLQALQARINPHFLFNSMNTIAALVRRDPHTAESAIEDLSDLFRAALGDENAEATLAEELQIARQYLAIEQLRLGTRLRLDWQLAADLPMQIRMPRLTLQPLFENAVIHGIAGLPEGGEIEVVAKAADGRVQLTISNPLPPGNPTVGHGHALDSIRRRLALYYGAPASLTETTDNGRFSIQLGIPNEPAA